MVLQIIVLIHLLRERERYAFHVVRVLEELLIERRTHECMIVRKKTIFVRFIDH